MESSPGIAEAKPKKLSLKLKLLTCAGWNFGTGLLTAMNLIQGDPVERTVLIFLGNVVFMNFSFWYIFRARDRSALVLQL